MLASIWTCISPISTGAQSELLVVFLCPEYAAKRWCNLEWRHIRQLIATLDATRIMLVSFGDPGDLTSLGILVGDGYLNIGSRPAEEIADKIVERFRLNGGAVPSPTRQAVVAASGAFRADISRIDRYAPTELIGRDDELALLSDAWGKARRDHASSTIER